MTCTCTVTFFDGLRFDDACAAQTSQPVFMNDSSKYAAGGKVVPFNYMFFLPDDVFPLFRFDVIPA